MPPRYGNLPNTPELREALSTSDRGLRWRVLLAACVGRDFESGEVFGWRAGVMRTVGLDPEDKADSATFARAVRWLEERGLGHRTRGGRGFVLPWKIQPSELPQPSELLQPLELVNGSHGGLAAKLQGLGNGSLQGYRVHNPEQKDLSGPGAAAPRGGAAPAEEPKKSEQKTFAEVRAEVQATPPFARPTAARKLAALHGFEPAELLAENGAEVAR